MPSYSATYRTVNFPDHIAGMNASGCEHSVQRVWILIWSSTEGDTDQHNKPITAVHCLLSAWFGGGHESSDAKTVSWGIL